MSLRMSQGKIEQLQRAKAAAKEREERPSKRRLEREAKLAIAVFNVRALSRFPTQVAWPTFRAALTAKRYYLTVWCPACQNVACVDIRPGEAALSPGRLDQLFDPLPVLRALLSQPAICADPWLAATADPRCAPPARSLTSIARRERRTIRMWIAA
jgi:hypothetical protein